MRNPNMSFQNPEWIESGEVAILVDTYSGYLMALEKNLGFL